MVKSVLIYLERFQRCVEKCTTFSGPPCTTFILINHAPSHKMIFFAVLYVTRFLTLCFKLLRIFFYDFHVKCTVERHSIAGYSMFYRVECGIDRRRRCWSWNFCHRCRRRRRCCCCRRRQESWRQRVSVPVCK